MERERQEGEKEGIFELGKSLVLAKYRQDRATGIIGTKTNGCQRP